MEYLKLYGGPIQMFYTRIGLDRDSAQSTELDRIHLPWPVLLEARAKNPFPRVRVNSQGSSYKDEERANELIKLLNTTDDIMVFKIAMNALIRLAQGERAAPLYPGKVYNPDLLADLLEEAIRLSEEG